MKLAIVHDSLTEFGGAERVLQAMIHVFPSADVYTAYTNQDIIRKNFSHLNVRQLHASWAERTMLREHSSLTQLLAPAIWYSWDFSQYDVVISHSLHFLSCIVQTRKDAVHIQYIQSPPKNLFDLEPMTPLQHFLPYTSISKHLYQSAINSTPYILANSNFTKNTLFHLFGVSSTVLYPFTEIPIHLPKQGAPHYYLCISRLDKWKYIEIAIEACNKLHIPLKIIGVTNEKRYEHYLRSIAGPSISFLGFQSDNEIAELYRHAYGLIFPSKAEDFGIVPLESMAHGIPVIAYYGGGTKETVIEGITGMFFHEHTGNALAAVLSHFHRSNFKPFTLYTHAKRFSKNRFQHELQTYVFTALKKQHDGAMEKLSPSHGVRYV
jgi:glycosyltransferase involved in cell wall biosynthesis